MLIEENYDELKGDIAPYGPVLKKYGSDCGHINEMGFRGGISAWALLSARPKTFGTIEINPSCIFGTHQAGAKELHISFKFILGNSLEIELEKTDLLFIDTDHHYKQLRMELDLHNSKVSKYIIMHDTKTFGERDSQSSPPSYNTYKYLLDKYPDKQGLNEAIKDFLETNDDWELHKVYEEIHGLTILRRK